MHAQMMYLLMFAPLLDMPTLHLNGNLEKPKLLLDDS